MKTQLKSFLFLIVVVALLSACAPVKKNTVVPVVAESVSSASLLAEDAGSAQQPLMDNSGRYMSPYTQDGVMTEWCDMSINAKIGGTAGSTVGAVAGGVAGKMVADQVLGHIPGGGLIGSILGGLFGSKVGKKAGKSVALEAAGGMEKVKATSDMSFNSLRDMSVYLHNNHSSHAHYQAALDVTMEIYPELKGNYQRYISN